jgi:photosystem II stability/assembly factor-like uncharacterized protein
VLSRLRCACRALHLPACALVMLGSIVVTKAPELRVIDLERISDSAWRLRWNSSPGSDYQVQRTKNDTLGATGLVEWIPLLTLRATGDVSMAQDTVGPSVMQRFYRVVQFTNVDTQPPAIAFSSARVTTMSNGTRGLKLVFQALDNVGVASVTVKEGTNVLGAATPAGGDWVLTTPTTLSWVPARVFTAVARDPSGNSAESAPASVAPGDPDHLVPLGTNGLPLEGQALIASSSNRIASFIFRPGGFSVLGAGQGFFVQFPNGATIVSSNGQEFIEFVDAVAGFGSNSFIQLAQPLMKTGGPVRRIPHGALDFGDIASAFGVDPAEGIALQAFKVFPLRWLGGVIDERGLRRPRFGLVDLGLPLPEVSGDYADFTINWERGELQIPFSGAFQLPDGTAFAPTLRATPARPVWLTLRANGTFALHGRVDVSFPGGAEFTADLVLDDPRYSLQIFSPGIHLPALDALFPLLPAADNCVAAQATPAELDQAAQCLENLALGFSSFTAGVAAAPEANGTGAAAASAGAKAGEETVALPPLPVSAEASVLEAWAALALAPGAPSMSLAELRLLTQQAARSADAAGQLSPALQHMLAMLRIRLAVAQGALNGDPADEADLNSNLGEVMLAAARHAADPQVGLTIESMNHALGLLIQADRVRSDLGFPSDLAVPHSALHLSVSNLFRRFIAHQASALGVKPGVFLPDSNPTVSGLNRFAAFQAIVNLIEVSRAAEVLSLAENTLTNPNAVLPGPIEEMYSQLSWRLLDAALDEIARAEQARDEAGYTFALRDLVEVMQIGEILSELFFRQVPGAPPRPDLDLLEDLGIDWMQLFEESNDRDQGNRSLVQRAEELRRLLFILREMPPTVTFAAGPFERAHQRLDAQLAEITSTLSNQTDLLLLFDVLDGGILHAQLRQRFNFPGTNVWETNRLPLVVACFAGLAEATQSWTEINRAIALLMAEAKRLGAANDHQRRAIYLQQAGVLLGAARRVAVALWNDRRGGPVAGGAAPGVKADGPIAAGGDMTLPSGIVIENIFGSAEFNRLTGEFSGGFGGTLRLPEFNATLTIVNASIASGGAFDIAASGQFLLPPEDPVLTVTIPESRPVRFQYSPENGPSFSGAAHFQFSNGVFFNGDISLIDPIYSFSFTAGGLEFALAGALAQQVPAFPAASNFGEADIETWNNFFENLSDSLAPVTAAADGVVAPNAAKGLGPATPVFPPEPFASVEAYAEWAALQSLLEANPDPATAREALTDMLVKLAEQVFKNADEHGRLEQAGGAAVAPAKAMNEKGGLTNPRAIQFDFGTAGLAYNGTGPAHAEGMVNASHTSWNTATSDRASGLVFADGSPAAGVSLNVGRRLRDGGLLEMGFQPVSFSNAFRGDVGILDNALLRDGITTFNLSDLDPAALAVRVSGLGPGYYVVYGIAVDSPLILPVPGHTIEARRISGSAVGPVDSLTTQGPTFVLNDWASEFNYARVGADLAEAGDDLLVLAHTSPGGGELGKLQGLQLVETKPVIIDFSLSRPTVDTGEQLDIGWDVLFATNVTITGFGAVPPAGLRVFSPQHTTTFKLTAQNSSGTMEQTVTITVDGPNRQAAALAEGLAKMAGTYRKITGHLKDVADRNLKGMTEYVDLQKVEGQLNRAKAAYRGLTNNPAALRNFKIFKQIAGAGLDLGATYQTTGLDDPVTHAEATAFFEMGKREFERRLGGDPVTGEPNLSVVNAKSAAESERAVNQIVELGAIAGVYGTAQQLNGPLVKAHIDNARTKLLAPIGFNPGTGQVNLAGVSEADTRNLSDRLRRLDVTASGLGQSGSTPAPVYIQLGDYLQARALESLGRIPAGEWQKRFRSLDNLTTGNDLRAAGNAPAAFIAEIRQETLLEAGQMNASAGNARLTAPELQLLSFMVELLPDAEVQALLVARAQGALTGLQAAIAEPWDASRLKEGAGLVNELVEIHRLLTRLQSSGGSHSIAASLLPVAQIPVLRAQFTAAAEGANKPKDQANFSRALSKAVALLDIPESSPAGRAKGGGTDPLVSVLRQQANLATLGTARLLSNQVAVFQQASNSFNPLDLGLPASLRVTRVFGSVLYNRHTGFLQGGFGGRLEFPDINAFFEVRNATLDNRGNFTIDAATGLPLPFGGVHLNAELIAANTNNILFISGLGEMLVPSGTSTQVFAVSLTYDQAGQRLALDSTAQNLDLRLSDDFVIFDAGFGFDVSTTSPAGSFRASGSAGLFAKPPLPADVSHTNFHLSIDNLTTVFSYTSNSFAIALSNGTFRLPDFFEAGFCPTNAGEQVGPAVALVPANPLTVTIGGGATPSASFAGAVDFRNLGFRVPGLTNLGVEICSAQLQFRSNALPALTDLTGTIAIPLPQDTAVLDITGVEWSVDGFPTAAEVSLREPLTLIDLNGLAFEFGTNSAFGFSIGQQNGQPTTTFELFGDLRGEFDAALLADANTSGAFSFGTSGTFAWTTGELPTFDLDTVTFGGRLKLGGANGFELLGVDANGIPDTNSIASVSLAGLDNIFDLAPSRTLDVRVSGALGSADFLFFGLGDARFVFDGAPPEPQFSVGSVGFREGSQLALLGQSLLPFRITSGSIAFKSPTAPLERLFDPTNLIFTLSGQVNISLGDTNDSTVPRLFGAVDNVQVSLPNGFNGLPSFSVNTFALALENLTIGDMAGLSGGLAIGNLNDPPNLFFAGMVGGGYNGVGIKAIVATRLDGLLGLCLSANAGPAGIPLDGGTLGGILLTGAEGGVSFLNNFADPCDFASFLNLGPGGTPPAGAALSKARGPDVASLSVIPWDELARRQKLHEQNKALRRQPGAAAFLAAMAQPARAPKENTAASLAKDAGADVPCPTGDCPPATLNLLCQRHPSVAESPSFSNYDGRYASNVIFKFSSLDRETVDQMLAAAGINLNGPASVVAANFANATTNLINGLIPRPPANMPAPQRAEVDQFINDSLVAMRALVASASQAALEAAAGEGRTPLEAIYEAAYAGVKCVDITIQLKGTFSYAPVSVALSATGGAVASTTGSAGILGSVNLFGLPVGTGEFFYSLTDTNGNPNPALCGGARIALGPLQLGEMGLAIGCDECVTGTLLALADFVQDLSGQVLADAQPIIYSFIEHAVSNRTSNVIVNLRSQPLTAFFGAPGSGVLLSPEEQIAVMTELLNLPQVALFLQNNPGAVSEFGNAAVQSLANATIALVLNIYNSTNPRLQFCGEVEPKLFGFSLTGGNTLVAARAFADKTNLRGDATFSPSYVFGNMPFFLLSGGAVNNVVPALDEATMGFSLGLPLVNETTLRLLTTNPVQFASTQVDHLLANATLTFGYELSPFGFKLADGEGRVSLPTLGEHPDNPARRAARPGDYVNGLFVAPSFPDRGAILKAALDSNVLAQATWAGKGNDLANLFPAGSAAANAVAGRELVRDYFPYGGFLGASKVQLPKPITDAPPLAQLAQIFAPPTNLLQQLTVAQQVFNDYVLGSREVGQLAVYVPFPKPPAPFWAVAQGPGALIDTIAAINEETLVSSLSLYPVEQFFMRGDVNAQFLGLPLAQGELIADPALGLFRLHAGTPSNSWMSSFFDAQMTFEIRAAQYIAQSAPTGAVGTNAAAQPENRLQAAFDELLAATAPGSTQSQRQQALSNAVERITDTLPKVSLDLALNNFGIPPALTNVLTANASARFVAYSPRFEPSFPGTGPMAEARRNGGVALQGQFNFANYVVIDNAELGVALPETGLPALSGLFEDVNLNIPGLALHDADFAFHSDPLVGDAYIAASGSVDPIVFVNPFNGQTLLSVRNLTNAGAPISANFELNRALSGPPLPEFAISPSRIDMPMLGPTLSARIHGATTNNPFGFSSTGPWAAKVSIVGEFRVNDLFGNEVLRLGAVGQQFSASVSGNGLSLGVLDILLPNNITLTAFHGTPQQQVFSLTSGGVTNRILISGDGTFLLEGGLAGNLPLNGLGFGSISAGASIRVDNNQLRVTINGNLTGGAINGLAGHATIGSLSGEFIATRNGLSLSGAASVSPMQFGVFRVSGTTGGNITAVLTNTGFSIPSGARLRIQSPGYPTNDIFTLNAFGIAGNGDFIVSAQSGALNIPGYFSVTEGSFTLIRSNTVASLDILSPTLDLFPGKPYASEITPPIQHVFIASNGRFYADSGTQQFELPGGFVARGRLEFGYEPDSRVPGIGFGANRLDFGTVTYGLNSNRVINVTNTGEAPLYVDIASSQSAVFTATPASLNLDPDEVAAVSVRFNPPPQAGPAAGTLTFFHNAPGNVSFLTVTGSVRAVPLLRLSSTSLDLGDARVGQPLTYGFRVENLGLTNLLITNRIVSGPFTVTPTNAIVSPLSNVMLQVTFTPGSIANFNGTLEIRANDGGGIRNVPLAGAGSVISWVDLRNGGEWFRAIAASGSSNVIAVSSNRVLYTDNKGHSWSEPVEPQLGLWRAAAMAGNTPLGWIAGENGLFRRTTDGGRTWNDVSALSSKTRWTAATEQPGRNRVALAGRSALGQHIVAIERLGGTFDIETLSTSPLDGLVGLAWANVGPGIGLAAGSIGRVFRSVDDGATWLALTNLPNLLSGIAMNNNGVALVSAYTTFASGGFNPPAPPIGHIFRSANFGTTWTHVFSATGFVFNAISIDGAVAYAVGKQRGFEGPGVVYRSGNSGTTWVLQDVDTPGLYAVSARSGETFVAGEDGDLHRRPAAPPTRGVLNFDPGSPNFGFVPFGDSAPRPITFHNTGISNIVLTNVTVQGPSASQIVIAGALPLTIPPGSWGSLNVFFNPTNATTANASLRIFANDPEGPFNAQIIGRSSVSGWVLKGPLTTNSAVSALAVQMVSPTIGYALTSGDLFKTIDGGVTWTANNSPAATFRAMHWIDVNQGFLAGGSFGVPPVIAGSSFIYRTLNGGSTWTLEYSDTDQPVSDIHVASSGIGYAVTSENFRLFNDSGDVLRTINNGASWTVATRPETTISPGALAVVGSGTELFVGEGPIVYRSANTATNWTPVLTNGSSSVLDIDFIGPFGIAVGFDGALRRTVQGGDSAAEWSVLTPFTTNDLGAIEFGSLDTVWALPTSTAPQAQIYRSDDTGSSGSWRDELAESPFPGPGNLIPTVISATSPSNAVALGTGGSVRRFERFVNEFEGIAVTQPVFDFGAAIEGSLRTTNLLLRNLGDRTLSVSNLLVDGLPGTNESFRVSTAVPFSVAANGSRLITIVTSNLVVGTNEATLSIVSDGVLQSLNVELRSVVTPAPRVVSFLTDPPGLSLVVDGLTVTAPISRMVRAGAAANEWEIGSLHAITALETQVVNGVTFVFDGWLPFEERGFAYMATNRTAQYVASYIAVGEPAPPAPPQSFGFTKAAKAGPPAGLPTGPYLRLTEASISNSILGAFEVSGAVLLSAENIEATLESRALRLPRSPAQPAVAELSAGAWRFSLSNSLLRLKAQTPSLKVVGNIVNPPSTLALDMNLANQDFRATFTLPKGVKIAPGLLEVGTSSLVLAHTNFLTVTVNGEVRAFREPDGVDWAFRQSREIVLREGPFTNSIPLSGSLLRITVPGTSEEFFEARGLSGARFELRRSGSGAFSLFLTNLAIDVLNQNIGSFSGLASTAGLLTLSANPPTSPFQIGPFRWHATEPSSIEWNVRNGSLKVALGAGTLDDNGSSVPGWPSGGLQFPGFEFESNGDFEKTILLTGFSFDGISMSAAENAEDSYITFKRNNGVLSVKLRDKHEFFGSTMRLGFDINSAGQVSGFFNGSFGVDFGIPLGYFHFGSVSLSYDSTPAESGYEFRGKMRVRGNDFRVKFGSGGAEVCHLYCDDDGCSQTVCLGF